VNGRGISLKKLFEDVHLQGLIPDVKVNGISIDSRKVKPGDLFIAQVGRNVDGHRYIKEALARGAVAVLGTRPNIEHDVPYVQIEDDREMPALLAAAFYNHPARKLVMIGVTGTDGKTTTASLLFHILREAGVKVGMVSTVSAMIGDKELDTGFHVTTPEPMDMPNYLDQMVAAGLTHAIIETTSHGLASKRVIPTDFDIAVVTNITHEHLDFHGSYEAYRAAKARLFHGVSEVFEKEINIPRLAVLNRDDTSHEYLTKVATTKKVSYGLHPDADIRAENIRTSPAGLQFMTAGKDFNFEVNCQLLGKYNVSNCLAAISVGVLGAGVSPESAQRGIANFPGVPGRMEIIDMKQDFIAIVDFAHTPNALMRSLEASREITSGKVIAVFGSAGLRDRLKRRMMAEVSADLADLSILTAEDPRTESLDDILAEMASGVETKGGVEGKTFWRIPDRGNAIRFAIQKARKGDLVIVCGKGHEQSMCFDEIEYPWDDRTAIRAALAELLDVNGPKMPKLPTSV
jgi:UDP-N-acetylmuramoyl-L-alanyl-D-glutamate--2,6-diaminopimelate ligase